MVDIAINFFTTLGLFVLVFSLLAVVHEFGHFLPARYFGVKVDVFSVGMGKEIFGITDKKKTRWRFGLLPLGGYVQFAGDENISSTKHSTDADPNMLHNRSVLQRIIVTIGGPAANYLLAMVLFFSLYFFVGNFGMSTKIADFTENSPAKTAGLMVGDSIQAINGEKVQFFQQVVKKLQKTNPSEPLSVSVDRNGEQIEFQVSLIDLPGDNGRKIIGIKPSSELVFSEPYGFMRSVKKAFIFPFEITWITLNGLINMAKTKDASGLAGPIAIANVISEAASHGAAIVLFYAALISVGLGFFNLLPIPALDGGHLFFYFIELIRGKPLSEKVQDIAMKIGIAILIAIFLGVFYQDIMNLPILKKILS